MSRLIVKYNNRLRASNRLFIKKDGAIKAIRKIFNKENGAVHLLWEYQFLKDNALLPFDIDYSDYGVSVWDYYGANAPTIESADWAMNSKCVQFDGTSVLKSDNINIMQFGTANFVVECFVKVLSTGFIFMVDSGLEGITSSPRFGLGLNIDGTLQLLYATVNTAWTVNTAITGINLFDGEHHHVAVERYNNRLYIYVDGIIRHNTSFTYNLAFLSSMVLVIAGRISVPDYVTGQFDQFFIAPYAKYKGKAFTVPTIPYAFNYGV